MSSVVCSCNRAFGSEQNLRAHRKAVAAHICPDCNRCLRTNRSLLNHRAALSPACGQTPLKNICSWRCNDCGDLFDSRAALEVHFRLTEHAADFRCCDCNRAFKSSDALDAHLKDKVHAKPRARRARCEDCDRTFKNKAALEQHLKSTIHCPISNLPCLAGKLCGVECNTHFRSPSAMVAHMENGSCSSGMDREKLNRLISLHDRENLITSSSGIAELSGWASLEDEEGSPSHSGVMTPSTESGEGVLLTPSSSQLDLVSLVGQRLAVSELSDSESVCTELAEDAIYHCPLCPNSRRRFPGRTALEQHMQSAAHTPKVFHCPSLLFQAGSRKVVPSMKRFSTLSGLVSHIESGACRDGKAGLRTVMQYMEDRLEELGISFKLLGI
ncbi:hypothetical protein BBK36DRAFT_1155187 [Trichoderma citrinoviride]|uniref:C2H2-type domain-containing protein n=1 Tax=Trichoderma citrinoviride TaxID=58853 RepID=A0A2T4BM44_9HYPO|nr:hypothetical protein BBK36DRAFT_1155187 [Trichoderma citrinoviride]PTB70376.1 hypothetical protein BBK36DRAFT_1155187 [Trichoderma citrinoviride]